MKLSKLLMAGATLFSSIVTPISSGIVYATESPERIINGSFTSAKDGVEFTKTVEQTDQPDVLKVTMTGKAPIPTTREKVAVVVVFDESGSMFPSSTSNKYSSAKEAAIAFSEQIVDSNSPVDGIVGLVKFGTNITGTKTITKNAFTNSDFTATRSTNSGQYTNLQQGISEGVKLLNSAPSDHKKFIIVISDGVPTACQGTGNGASVVCEGTLAGMSNSNLSTKRASNTSTPESNSYKNSAIALAKEAKDNRSITFLTLGYDITSGSAAEETLKSIATGSYNWRAPGPEDISGILNDGIAPAILGSIKANDTIGEDFTYVDNSGTISQGSISVSGQDVTCDFGKDASAGAECSFNIRLNKTYDLCESYIEPTDLVDTNNGASLDYYTTEKFIKTTTDPQYRVLMSEQATQNCVGEISVTKNVENTTMNDVEFHFIMTITSSINGRKPFTGSLAGATSLGNGSYSFTLKNGETKTFHLSDSKAGIYDVEVEETWSGMPKDYYCKDYYDCSAKVSASGSGTSIITLENSNKKSKYASKIAFTATNRYEPEQSIQIFVKKIVEDDDQNADYNRSWNDWQDKNQTFDFTISIPVKENCNSDYGVMCSPFTETIKGIAAGESGSIFINDARGLDLDKITVVESTDLSNTWFTADTCSANTSFAKTFTGTWECKNIWKYEAIPAVITVQKVVTENAPEELPEFVFSATIKDSEGNPYTGRYKIGDSDWLYTADGTTEKFSVSPTDPVVIELDDVRGNLWIITITEDTPDAELGWTCKDSICEGTIEVSENATELEYTAVNIYTQEDGKGGGEEEEDEEILLPNTGYFGTEGSSDIASTSNLIVTAIVGSTTAIYLATKKKQKTTRSK